MTRIPLALLLAALPILSACGGACSPSGCDTHGLALVAGASTHAPAWTYLFMTSSTSSSGTW